MRIVLTGGGTGGHISVLLALLPKIQDKESVVYIGYKHGIEVELFSKLEVSSFFIQAGKFRRYWSWQNFLAPYRTFVGFVSSLRILSKFKPDIVFSSGGFVSLPVVFAAKMLRIPLVIHEQTTTMGLANKVASKFASKICLSFPTETVFDDQPNVVVTGNPVRREILRGNKTQGMRILGFDNSLPVTLVMGGSQGAHFLNRYFLRYARDFLGFTQLVLVTGDNEDYQQICGMHKTLLQEYQPRMKVYSYITNELGDIYAVANLVVSRSGAGTVAELGALRKPCVLIPLPKSTKQEQQSNAKVLESRGQALVLDQWEIGDSDLLLRAVKKRVTDFEERERMSQSVSGNVAHDSVKEILEVLTDVLAR